MVSRSKAVIDFETKDPGERPDDYPPIPVGVAIDADGKNKYLAWGHPTGNNCTKQQAKQVLKNLFKHYKCIFHNAPFDIEVGVVHLDLPFPEDFEDTLILAFLNDPRDDSLALKEWCNKYLGLPPDEQSKLKDWIIKHIPEATPETKKNPWGKYICKAPGDIVSPYAKGDTKRTKMIYDTVYPYIVESGMLEAYRRELKAMPLFMGMSQGGIRVATNKLKRDLGKWEKEHKDIAIKIKRRLKAKDLDITSSPQLADALDKAGKIDEWIYTAPSKTFPQGQRSTKRENLIRGCNDKTLIGLLSRYGMLSTYMSTFAKPWIETAERTGGYIYPTFNQTRSTDMNKSRGTRTGRPSSQKPNLLNVPRDPEDPDIPWTLGLPKLRNYLIPDEGFAFLIRDYNQQELRLLAHFEDDQLLKIYSDNPLVDIHEYVRQLIYQATGILYPRKFVKTVNFGVVYGMGAEAISYRLNIPYEEARKLKSDHSKTLPGIKDLNKEIKAMSSRDEPIRTWGGRLYYTEEPKIVKGRMRSFEYKLLNYLIQGSAADVTKQAMINIAQACEGRLVVQVYDEIIQCVPHGTEKKQMLIMQEAMLEMLGIDVPMFSDGKIGRISWGQATKYKDPVLPWS